MAYSRRTFLILSLALAACSAPAPVPESPGGITLDLPDAAPLDVGDAISLEETSAESVDVTTTGMRGNSHSTTSADTSSTWSLRVLKRFSKFCILDTLSKESRREGTGRMESQVDPIRASAAINFESEQIEYPIPAESKKMETGRNRNAALLFLIRRLEKAVGGKKLAIDSALPLDDTINERLFLCPFRSPLPLFTPSHDAKSAVENRCVLKETRGGAAVFQLKLARQIDAFVGHLRESAQGAFRIDLKTGRVVSIDVTSTYGLEDNRFYETIDGKWSTQSRIDVRYQAMPPAPGPFNIQARLQPGQKFVASRYERSLFAATFMMRNQSGAEPRIEFVEEIFAEKGELRARRRYTRCDTGSEKVDALEGHSFVLGLDSTIARIDGDASLFPMVAQDERVYAWLPKHPVHVGDFWTPEGPIPEHQTLDDKNPFAMLLAVRPSSVTGNPEAHILIMFDLKNSVLWEREKPQPCHVLTLVVDLTAQRLVRVHHGLGDLGTVYTPLGTERVNWTDRTHREKVIDRVKAQFDEAKKLYTQGQTGRAIETFRALSGDMTMEASFFVPELEFLLEKFIEANDGETARNIAGALQVSKPSEAHFRSVLQTDFISRDWKRLNEETREFMKVYPARPEGYIYQAIPLMNARKFKEALGLLQKALSKVQDDDPAASSLRSRIHLWSARAELNTGDFAAAHRLLDQAFELTPKESEQNEILELMSQVMQAEKLKLYISFRQPDFLPLGMYHLMSERNGPLPTFINLHLINGSEEDRIISVSSDVQDVTYTSTDQVLLPGRKSKEGGSLEAPFNMRVYQTPPLRKEFNVNSIVEEIERPIHLVVKEKTETGDRVLLDQTIPVTLWPRTRLILIKYDRDSTGDSVSMEKSIAAWVTPRSPFVERFISDAKKMLPQGVEFVGGALIEKYSAKDQVRAMYDHLKSRGTSYVAYTSGAEKTCEYQDMRLPAQVYRTTNNLCVEGTVMFASLMEGIGLSPIIVLVPGHAFVGWHDEDGPVEFQGNRYFVLETTSIARHDFETALSFAEDQFTKYRAVFESKRYWNIQVLDIRKLRALGYKPQPYPEE